MVSNYDIHSPPCIDKFYEEFNICDNLKSFIEMQGFLNICYKRKIESLVCFYDGFLSIFLV